MSNEIFTPSNRDAARAQRKATQVLQSVATPEMIFAATQVMLDAGTDHTAGYRAYYLSLFNDADADTQGAAADAFSSALAESEARHNARHAAPIEAELVDDNDDDDDDDNEPFIGDYDENAPLA